jgi:multidrug transporter EmrE-like cation transporter
MTMYYGALGVSILAGIVGQVLLKVGADAPDFWSQIWRPSTIVGLMFYAAAAFLYIIALRKIPMSVAFPSVSVSYAIVAVAGYLFFQEPLGLKQVAGIVLIMGGVALINQA